jgi:thiol-disulfide isomerase/thioredoxin
MRRVTSSVAALLAMLLTACATSRSAPVDLPATLAGSRVHALLVNGGARKSINFRSHLEHLRAMYGVVGGGSDPAGQIVVLASDGPDPTPDLATRTVDDLSEAWLLDGTRLGATLRSQVRYVDSKLDGVTLGEATPEGLRTALAAMSPALRPGDVLLLYVTDHGTRDASDTHNNRISLWGENASISVEELRSLLAEFVPAGVRVVSIMSQCFSGAFARLGPTPAPDGVAMCGYFSTTAERPAYGCYPEVRERNDLGHSVHFIRALATHGSLAHAHESVLVRDDSPDVPLRSSDVLLEDLLSEAAVTAGTSLPALGDARIAEALRDSGAWESHIRRLDRIADQYGLASPRRVTEVDEQIERVRAVSDELRRQRDAWRETFSTAAQANVSRFADAEPVWKERLAPDRLGALSDDERIAVRGELIDALGAHTRHDERVTYERLQHLREKRELATQLVYRMQVRLGVLLRLRALLIRLAGEAHLAALADPEARAAFDEMVACETIRLPVGRPEGIVEYEPEAFPSYAADLSTAERFLPAWLGLQFRGATEAQRTRYRLAAGAAHVQAVFPDSPAARAGIASGDVIVGTPAEAFVEPGQVRAWTMLSDPGETADLMLLRDGATRRVSVTLQAYPRTWPKLPEPPQPGDPAPALDLEPYRGSPPTHLSGAGDPLLFFWATWCSICKAALPELAQMAARDQVRIVSITDEDAGQLTPFFARFQEPFPGVIASDPDRRSFLAYGIAGTPSFVLVGPDGRIRGRQTGYSRKKGLHF